MTKTPMNIRAYELARKPNRELKTLRELFVSHGVPTDDALQMAIKVYDLYGVIMNSTPSAYIYRTAMEQLSFWKEFHM